jgi:hypothetical protein
MEWIISDKYSETRIIESENVVELKKFIQLNNINCKVILYINDDFWSPPQLTPCCTSGSNNIALGHNVFYSRVLPEYATRPIADDKNVMISIKFNSTIENYEQMKLCKLNLTKNYKGEDQSIWSFTKIYKNINYRLGVYKKDGFDYAFNQVKMLNPEFNEITEKQFAHDNDKQSWDTNLVYTKLYTGDDCIDTVTKTNKLLTNNIEVNITLLTMDIKNNLQQIKKLLL